MNEVNSSQEREDSQPQQLTQSQPKCSGRQILCNIIMGLILGVLGGVCAWSALRQVQVGQQVQIGNEYLVTITDRGKLEQPKRQQNFMMAWQISKYRNAHTESTSCALISAGNIVTKNTINTIIELLEGGDRTFGVVFLVASMYDYRTNILFKQKLADYYIFSEEIQFAAHFPFANTIKNQCKKLVYTFGNFVINKQMALRIGQQVDRLEPKSLYFTSNYLKNNITIATSDLQKEDLSLLDPLSLYCRLYIFDPQYMPLLAPVNFLYYGKHTLEQILLVPALVMYQSWSKMATNDHILFQADRIFVQGQEFTIRGRREIRNSLCFVSYPNDPYVADSQNAISYLTSIKNQQTEEGKQINGVVVVYLPYIYGKSKEISVIGQWVQQNWKLGEGLQPRIKIMSSKIPPSYAVYESAYTFCPNRAIIVSSRHNIRFHTDMTSKLLNYTTIKYHYYQPQLNFQSSSSDRQNYNVSFVNFTHEFVLSKGTLFQDLLIHVQIFKSDLLKMIPFWILKSAELDFYETEAPFVSYMMQTIRNIGIKEIPLVLASVVERTLSQTERTQIQNCKHYSVYSPMHINYLMPYLHNCLQNPAFRRSAPPRIPPLIHQIWLSKTGVITQVRQTLHQTMVKANPNFTVRLWRNFDLTVTNFPLAYNLISSIVEKNKQSKRTLFVLAADLMRYEILVNWGGIYVDFKWQGNKPLDPFLKYESIYIDFDIKDIRFGRPKALGNGFLGGMPNSYHLKIVLTELLTEHTLNFGPDVSYTTGGWVVRKALTDNQIFTQMILGYHLIDPKAYEYWQNFCQVLDRPQTQRLLDSDQAMYEMRRDGKTYKFPLPCKIYPEAYAIIFSPLEGTWVKQGADLN